MIDKNKIAPPAAYEIGILLVYMIQHNIIRISDVADVTDLISHTFVRIIDAYNEMEDENEGKR